MGGRQIIMEGEEGVGITYKGTVSWMRTQCHGRGHSVTDEGTESLMRAQCHGQGHSEGGVSSMDEGMARGMSAPWMRRVVGWLAEVG